MLKEEINFWHPDEPVITEDLNWGPWHEEEKKMEKETVYKVNEIFESIQGEGYHTGLPVIFIRLAGCSMGCKWCDTKYCQKVNETLTAKQILQRIELSYIKKNIVITGGEPFEQDLYQLVDLLTNNCYNVHIETNGAHEISREISIRSWITVSPKAYVKSSSLDIANEIKLVITNESDIERAKKMISHHKKDFFYLQPESGKKDATKLCLKACLEDPRFRLSAQVHKLIDVR